MAELFQLNGTTIHLDRYQETREHGLRKLTVEFKVTHEDYHAITTLLYEKTFEVKVPERGLLFIGTIENYSTSITNLYKPGTEGIFQLSLIELV